MGPTPRGVEIIVDDGHVTSLDRKRDGIQSLAAIALLRRAAMDRGQNRTFVLAVEEPEAHLPTFAIRELRSVLGQIATDQQVALTTQPLELERTEVRPVSSSHARSLLMWEPTIWRSLARRTRRCTRRRRSRRIRTP